ncbi:MAG: alpha/beta hydrolase-fold protein [Planctomycetota bacterium]
MHSCFAGATVGFEKGILTMDRPLERLLVGRLLAAFWCFLWFLAPASGQQAPAQGPPALQPALSMDRAAGPGDVDEVRRRLALELVRALQVERRPEPLAELATQVAHAERQADWPGFYRLAGQALAALAGEEWTAERELAFAWRPVLELALVSPGGPAILEFERAYEPSRLTARSYQVELVLWRRALVGRGARQRVVGQRGDLESSLEIVFDPPLQPGAYEISAHLRFEEGPELELRGAARLSVAPQFAERCRELARQRNAAERRLGVRARERVTDALLVARYPEDLAAQMRKGLTDIQAIAVERELAWAERTLEALEAGEQPLTEWRGDSRRVHHYSGTDALYPYRVYVPQSFDEEHSSPLVVALHGLGGDEMSWDIYGGGALFREAEKRGLIVVCPLGIDRASFYIGHAQGEIFELIAELTARLPIDRSRIYLMGHSMGGFGTFSLAIARPELFAALAPISGGGDPSRAASIAHLPQFIVHGSADRIVPVAMSRLMFDASRRAGADVRLEVVPGGDHMDVVMRKLPAILDWLLTKHR